MELLTLLNQCGCLPQMLNELDNNTNVSSARVLAPTETPNDSLNLFLSMPFHTNIPYSLSNVEPMHPCTVRILQQGLVL